ANLLFVRENLELSPLVDTPSFSNVAHNTLIHTRPSMIEHVLLGGKWIIKNRTCLTLDESLVMKEYRAIMERVFSKTL
ncbi:MAG: hypothetical protein ACQ5SW_05955, partial [Sphaerochaetaceae bacterium]